MSILSWLKRRRSDDDDLDEEIRAHLAIAEAERMADGADRRSAQLDSLKEFGNVAQTQEAARGVWTPWWVDALRDQLADIRYAIRALARNPGFTVTVVCVLALGIGLNAAVFTLLKGLALTPLAGVENSASLVLVHGETGTGRAVGVSYPDYLYLRDHNRSFTKLMGSAFATMNYGHGRNARPITVELVTGNFFEALGVRAQRGRTLLPSDEVAPGQHPVVVISDAMWRRELGADPAIIGKTIEINARQLTVVGVADAAFHGTIVSYDAEVFLPVMTAPELGITFGSQQKTASGILADRTASVFYPEGFLRPGATVASAAAEAEAIWATLSRERPLTDPVRLLRVVRFWQEPNSAQMNVLPLLAVLSAMGLLVLLIACANIAGLVLVRGISRRGEIAVRLALGATRTRIVRLLIVENLVLAVPGVVLGLLLSWWSIPLLLDYAAWLAAPQRLFFNIEPDALVIGFAALVGCGCALVFGFVPALRASQIGLASAMNEDASPRGAARGRLRAGLVIGQVAVSLLLLVGAGLAARTVDAARRADPGFDAQQVSALEIDVRQNNYDAARGRVFYRQLLLAARGGAGVESATLAAFEPLAFLPTRSYRVAIEGYQSDRGEDLAFMGNTIGPDYFRTLRIPLVAGREFDDRDDEAGEPVAVVNATMAQRFWGSADKALGKRLRVTEGDWRRIVGVAADVKYVRINETPRPYFYLPFEQGYRSNMVLHTRGTGSVDGLVDQARARIAALDPDLPLIAARPLTERFRGAFLFYDFAAAMLFVFGVTGMALAGLGTYGLVSYTVKQSTHEIGIRMALGATAPSVLRGFLGRGLRLGAIGAAVGIIAALAVSNLLADVLFGVSTTDAVSFGGALAVVLAGVILATLVPAWRAARTSPLSALRHQ